MKIIIHAVVKCLDLELNGCTSADELLMCFYKRHAVPCKTRQTVCGCMMCVCVVHRMLGWSVSQLCQIVWCWRSSCVCPMTPS